MRMKHCLYLFFFAPMHWTSNSASFKVCSLLTPVQHAHLYQSACLACQNKRETSWWSASVTSIQKKMDKGKVETWIQTLCLPTDSLGVQRLRGHSGGDHNLLPPQWFSLFLSTYFLYPPKGSLQVHRNRGWFGEEPQLLPPPLFLVCQQIPKSVLL